MDNTLRTHVRIGEFELDLTSGRLHGPDQTIYLPEKPLRVLTILIEFEGRLVGREDIKKRLWPNDTVVDFEHGINTSIKTLRRSLGDSADKPTYIETVPRRGYRLMVPVQRIVESSEPAGSEHTETTVEIAEVPGLQTHRGVLIGRTVSHYRVLGIIGGGGMGVVYRAEDLKLGRAVALKFLPEDMGNDQAALERFNREARAASCLDHPNICAIHEFGEHESQPFIVMPLFQGQTLRDRLAAVDRPLPLNELVEIATQVCEGLQAAHERGVIHRDIKPANIFLTSKGTCKILDFGLAKLLEAEEKEATMSDRTPPPSSGRLCRRSDSYAFGAAMGTAGYMSPEQIRGERLDPRSDLFSFGLVLYEMATGQRAFGGETVSAVQDAILHKTAVPLKELNACLPAKLLSIIDKALEKDREARYQSAAELVGDLISFRLEPRPASFALWTQHKACFHGRLLRRDDGSCSIGGSKLAGLRRARHLVLADFANPTGDPVFDGTLTQASRCN